MRLWYRFGRIWCRLYFNCLHFGRVYNRQFVPQDGPIILVSNHQSFFDPVLVGYGLDREIDYMARDSLFKNPIFKKLIISLNAFPVRRGEADIAAIKETLRRLKNNRAVLMFPEATRTADGKIREFKPGLALLAKKARVPIIPVVIEGAYDAWPRTSPAPKPFHPIHVSFSKPFSPEEIKNYSPEDLVRKIHSQMIKLQNQMRIRMGKKPYDYDQPI